MENLIFMPATKTENYTHEELFLAEFGKAIAHPARARMFFLLMNNGTFRNVDFTIANNISTSTTHCHIYKMKNSGLINLEYANHEYHVTFNLDVLELAVTLLQKPFNQNKGIKEILEKLEFENQ
jgi:hypothetical protein